MVWQLAVAGVMALAFSTGAAPADAPPPNSTPYSSATPPVRYQADNVAVVFFVNDVSPLCGKSDNPKYTILACQSGEKIALPNPCRFAEREFYARIVCHELGHRNGWAALHGD